MPDSSHPNTDNPPGAHGEPPLHRAARLGDSAEIRRLVAAGAPINAIHSVDRHPCEFDITATPFMVAARSLDGASVETLKVLLELGADPTVEIDGRSAVTFACQTYINHRWEPGGDAARLRFVLEAGCKLPSDPEDANRLICDAAAGDPERVRVLLDYGVNPRGYWDQAKAREEARRSIEDMAEFRKHRRDLLGPRSDEDRAASEAWNKKFDEESLERDSSAPMSRYIPLFRAARSGNAECVRLLLEAGADPAARDNSKRTAMYGADCVDVIRTLISAGVPLEDTDEYGWSPLLDAVNDGEEALPRIRALIEAGANVNGTHDRGYTVFMSAVGSNRHPAVMRLLVASGADPHAVTELGYNAFHAAIDVNFEANAEESVRDTLGYLRDIGVNIEHRTNAGQTPLAQAIQSGTGLEVRVLCELDADANASCRECRCGGDSCTSVERPLLFHAADGAGVEIDVKTEALLRAGANPLAMDADGFTALAHAVASLCEDAADSDETYDAFFKELGQVRLKRKPMPTSRDEFIAEATPVITAFVERFAAEIPISDTWEYAAQRRAASVKSIILLCVYEGFARHEYLRR